MLHQHYQSRLDVSPCKLTVMGKANNGIAKETDSEKQTGTHNGATGNTTNESKLYQCETCGHSFKQHSHYWIHKMCSDRDKPQVCDVCSKKFCSKRSLQDHIKTHPVDKPYKCNVCDETFETEVLMLEHAQTHETLSEKLFENEQTSEDRTADNTVSSSTHSSKSHDNAKSEEEGSLKCQVCWRSFRRKYNLKVHMRLHTGEKPFKCNMCDKSFHVKYSLTRHMILMHTTENAQTTYNGQESLSSNSSMQSSFSNRMDTDNQKETTTFNNRFYINWSNSNWESQKSGENEEGISPNANGWPEHFNEETFLQAHMQMYFGEEPIDDNRSSFDDMFQSFGQSPGDEPIDNRLIKGEICDDISLAHFMTENGKTSFSLLSSPYHDNEVKHDLEYLVKNEKLQENGCIEPVILQDYEKDDYKIMTEITQDNRYISIKTERDEVDYFPDHKPIHLGNNTVKNEDKYEINQHCVHNSHMNCPNNISVSEVNYLKVDEACLPGSSGKSSTPVVFEKESSDKSSDSDDTLKDTTCSTNESEQMSSVVLSEESNGDKPIDEPEFIGSDQENSSAYVIKQEQNSDTEVTCILQS